MVVSSYEAAVSINIEFDTDNHIFGLPREFVVATAGEHGGGGAANLFVSKTA